MQDLDDDTLRTTTNKQKDEKPSTGPEKNPTIERVIRLTLECRSTQNRHHYDLPSLFFCGLTNLRSRLLFLGDKTEPVGNR